MNLVDNGSIRDLANNRLTTTGALAFQSDSQIATGGFDPWESDLADLNGDAYPDMIIGYYSSQFVTIRLNNGNGSFGTATNYSLSGTVKSVVAADVNADGKLDVIATNLGGVAVFLGNGDGSMQAPSFFATVSSAVPWHTAVGDVNDDGNLDLVVAHASASVITVLLGNGDGTFRFSGNSSVAESSISVTLGDVDGDGKLDAVVISFNGTVRRLLGNGDGSFDPFTQVATGPGSESHTLADLNADGKLDIVVPRSGANFVNVLLGNGNGTFQTQVAYTVGDSPFNVKAADINGDGKLDLIAGQAIPIISACCWAMATARSNRRSRSPTGVEPFWVSIADLNNDSKSDLVASNLVSDSMSIRFNNYNGNFTGEIYTVDAAPLYSRSTARFRPVRQPTQRAFPTRSRLVKRCPEST